MIYINYKRKHKEAQSDDDMKTAYAAKTTKIEMTIRLGMIGLGVVTELKRKLLA